MGVWRLKSGEPGARGRTERECLTAGRRHLPSLRPAHPASRPHPGTPPCPCSDPAHFQCILTFLRDGRVPLPEAPLARAQLRQEARFYALVSSVRWA